MQRVSVVELRRLHKRRAHLRPSRYVCWGSLRVAFHTR
jgi:hypothetical protein